MQIALKNYQKLLQLVQKIIAQTQKNIAQNVNREKVVMSWQIGKIIEEHLLENDRANYGENFFTQLEKDTTISVRVLYQMRSFYRAYPTLPKQESDLSWSHYRSLSSLSNEESRKRLEQLTVVENLGAGALQSKISKIKKEAKARQEQKRAKKITKLSVKRGRVFTYKIVASPHSNKTLVDCGFNIFSEIKTTLKASSEVVESLKKGEVFSLKKSQVKKQQLHTYKAFLDRVVDGDTLHVTLDLGFKIQHKEILRLAKINAPEMTSEEGKKSAEFLQKILKNVKFLIIKTNKTDIYGRFVADVFFDQSGKEEDAQKVANSGTYLNQMLLDFGIVEGF